MPKTSTTRILLGALVVILLVLAACLLAGRGGRQPLEGAAALAAVGGSVFSRARRRSRVAHGGADGDSDGAPLPAGAQHPAELHPLGHALEQYARALGPAAAVAVHPLDRDRYEAPASAGPGTAGAATGGAVGARGGKDKKSNTPPPKKPWTQYATWGELTADPGAVQEYLAQRAEALNNPRFDWAPVLRVLGPKLAENREYIGVVNVEADGRTLRLEAHEASPVEAGTATDGVTFASVPGELVARYAGRPALFIFHTHPADPRGSPFPSSHDLSTAIWLATATRFAANAVVSRYGVFVYGLEWGAYQAVHAAKDPEQASLALSHDVVAAHEAVRSWGQYNIPAYLSFYARHQLYLAVYPSDEMVGDSRRYTYSGNLEAPVDYEFIAEKAADVKSWRERAEKGATASRRVLALGPAVGPAPEFD